MRHAVTDIPAPSSAKTKQNTGFSDGAAEKRSSDGISQVPRMFPNSVSIPVRIIRSRPRTRFTLARIRISRSFSAATFRDSWNGVSAPACSEPPLDSCIQSTPFFAHHVTNDTAADALQSVLHEVGCSRPALDDPDRRILDEVRSGKAHYHGSVTGLPGLPDSEDDVGGWCEYPTVIRDEHWDTDRDGIPDDWERAHGLSPSSAADASHLTASGDTELERSLHHAAGDQ